MRGLQAIFLFSIFLTGCKPASPQLCDHIVMREGELKLSANEKVLVCGSPKAGEGWRDVPVPQAQYQLTVLLQNQGYLHPRFERNGERLEVWSGPRELIKTFELTGDAGLLNKNKKRQVIGEPITPEKLDEVKRWADTELRARGYACPDVKVRYEAWNGTLVADVQPGPRHVVAGITYTGLGGLDTEAIARFQAIEPGNLYDVRQTQLTSARMLADGLFQTAYFTARCRDDKVDLNLVATVGKPRILRFGLGASTEEFPFTRISYKDARLDDRGSSFTSTLYASPLVQSLDLYTEFYRLPFSRRSYFGPRFFAARENERTYEVLRAKLGVDLGRQFDIWRTRLTGRIGPTLNYVNTVRGVGPTKLSYVSWEGGLLAMSHAYEMGQRDQYVGWQGSLDYRGQRQGIGSPINVDRYEVNFKYLWNVGGYAPPLFVLATRLQAIGLNTKQISNIERFGGNTSFEVADDNQLVPADYRVFFGGDQNLRGFGRHSLNNDGLGYTTALYMGFELRLIEELPYRLEPFFLFDSAQLGDRQLTLDKPLFISQGLGLRWPSPIGTLRGSAAQGRILNEDPSTRAYKSEWTYFLSFGQEF